MGNKNRVFGSELTSSREKKLDGQFEVENKFDMKNPVTINILETITNFLKSENINPNLEITPNTLLNDLGINDGLKEKLSDILSKEFEPDKTYINFLNERNYDTSLITVGSVVNGVRKYILD